MNGFEKINSLADKFSKFSGVGKKTAQKYAFDIIDFSKDFVEGLINDIRSVKESIRFCKICFGLSEEEICPICKKYDNKTICVVEKPKDIFILQNVYKGVFHVLHGVISPIEGKSADDLTIKPLLRRLDGVKEIILATNMTVEGEATAIYLSKIIKPFGIKVSRLAQGISMGSDIEYADEMTLSHAIKARIEI